MAADIEQLWFLYGIRIGPFQIGWLRYYGDGETASVGFDWEKGLHRWLLGWYHTHPGTKSLIPSSRDHATMRSWVRAIDKPFACGIMCNGEQRCYLFFRRHWKIHYSLMRSLLMWPIFVGIQGKDATVSGGDKNENIHS